MDYRKQKNLTITKEQADFIIANDGNMSISKLSKMLGISSNKVINNRYVLGLVKHEQAKVVQFDKDGYFDVDKFGRYYNF